MASELSRFIEDELKKQGIEDDEEQRLLSNLRVKPLSVQTPGVPGTAWTWKHRLILAAMLVVAMVGLVALITTVRSHHLQPSLVSEEVFDADSKSAGPPAGQASGEEGDASWEDYGGADYSEEDSSNHNEPEGPEKPKEPEAENKQQEEAQAQGEEGDYGDYGELEKEIEDELKREAEAEQGKQEAEAEQAKQEAEGSSSGSPEGEEPPGPAPEADGGRRRRRQLKALA